MTPAINPIVYPVKDLAKAKELYRALCTWIPTSTSRTTSAFGWESRSCQARPERAQAGNDLADPVLERRRHPAGTAEAARSRRDDTAGAARRRRRHARCCPARCRWQSHRAAAVSVASSACLRADGRRWHVAALPATIREARDSRPEADARWMKLNRQTATSISQSRESPRIRSRTATCACCSRHRAAKSAASCIPARPARRRHLRRRRDGRLRGAGGTGSMAGSATGSAAHQRPTYALSPARRVRGVRAGRARRCLVPARRRRRWHRARGPLVRRRRGDQGRRNLTRVVGVAALSSQLHGTRTVDRLGKPLLLVHGMRDGILDTPRARTSTRAPTNPSASCCTPMQGTVLRRPQTLYRSCSPSGCRRLFVMFRTPGETDARCGSTIRNMG